MAGEGNTRRYEGVPPATGTRSRLGVLVPLIERFAPHLAVASALLFVLGVWAPWAMDTVTAATPLGPLTSTVPVSGDSFGFTIVYQAIHPQPISLNQPVIFWSLTLLTLLWDALPLCGLLLSLALWQHASRVVLRLSLAWLMLSTVGAALGIAHDFSMAGMHACSTGCMTIDGQVSWGVWLTLVALGLAWIALWLLAQRPMQPGSASTRGWRAQVGAGAFAVGVVLWALAILLLPWVTAGCSGIPFSLTHFARGACMGLDGYDVLSAAIYNAPQSALALGDLDITLGALHIIEFFCATGACLVVLLWRPRWSRSLRVPVAMWLALATVVFVLCWYGTSIRLVKGGAVAYTTAPFVVGPAIAATVVALLLGWAGGVLIWLGKR